MPAGDGFSPAQRQRIDRAIREAETVCRYEFSVYVGPSEDEPRAFYRFPARRRAVVLVAGSLTHIVLAVVLIWLSLWVAGEHSSESAVGQAIRCLGSSVPWTWLPRR